MKTENFWTTEHTPPAGVSVSDLPTPVDVAIVGSGYTGLNAALALAKAGARVAVLEQQTIGWGASSRNGGMLTPGLKAKLKSIVQREGLEKARFFWQWSLDAIDHVAEVVREEDIDCDFVRPGHVALAYKPAHFEGYKKHVAWMKDTFGYTGGRLVAPSDLHAEIGSASYFGGISDDHSAALQPAQYVFGLARAVARHGVQLVEHAEVTGIQKQGSEYIVSTRQGQVRASEVLLATNGYTTGMISHARNGIFPIGSYVTVTEPLPADLQAELSPKGRIFYDSKWFLNYFRLTPDGRMLFGGRNNLSTSLDLHESAQQLQTRMLEVFPQLRDVSITHTWTGKLGITFDLMPHIGRVNGIHYAYGYGGHGASISSYLGKEIGQLIAGQKASTPFAEIKHPRSFITRFDKMYLPFVAAWYRLLDATT